MQTEINQKHGVRNNRFLQKCIPDIKLHNTTPETCIKTTWTHIKGKK